MSFNLLIKPWIPVSEKKSGATREVGICDALLKAHEWGEIQCASPLATVAILRMLLAILHRTCQPATLEDWQAMWEAEPRRFPESHITDYLNRFADRFDLFDENRPFLQIGKMSMMQAGTMAQLATEAATGNNPTLFDHASDALPEALTPAEAACRLLAAQSYALGFGKAAEAAVDGATWPRPYLADAICLRGVTVFLSGESLFETLMLNLMHGKARTKDIPFWELEVPLSVLDVVTGGKRVSQPAQGFVERYAWPSRMVRLVRDPDGFVRRAYFTQGREADKGEGDPMKVFIHSEKLGTYALNLNAEKAAWRDLQSYLGATTEAGKPGVFRQAGELVDMEAIQRHAIYRMNVVGLATDPGKAGKFLLWRHDRMSIPAALLSDPALVEAVVTALGDAEFVAGELRRRMYSVVQRFLPPEGNPDPKDVDNLLSAIDPRKAYWARLEPHFSRFLTSLADGTNAAVAAWRSGVEQEAERALRASCDQLGESTRAIKATARVSYRFTADKVKVNALIDAAKARKKAKGGKKT